MNVVDPLKASQQLCRQICRRSKSSFLASFALLDAPRRQAMHALYAFARIADDLGDSLEPIELRAAQLDDWRKQLWQTCAAGVEGLEPTAETATGIWPALAHCVRSYHVPIELLDDLITGVAMDIAPTQPADWSELEQYCYHVASCVGLACAHIWSDTALDTSAARASRGFPRESAIDCGIAFQLTNILRDVAEDAARGRVYVPRKLFDEYAVELPAWLSGRPTGNWPAMLEAVAERARQRYASGWHTIESLSPHSQRMFSLMWRSYRSLLEQVIVEKDRLWSKQRIRVPKHRQLGLFTAHLVPPVYSRLADPVPSAKSGSLE